MRERILIGDRKISNIRWRVAIILTIATAINYLDRMTLPVVISQLQQKFGISEY